MANRGRLIALEGESASGKTTLVRAAAARYGWVPLAEAYDRLDPAPSLEFGSSEELLLLEGALLAEEVRRYREAVWHCARGQTVLADTGFFGPLTYTWGLVHLGRVPPSVGRALTDRVRPLVRKGALGLPDLTIVLRTTRAERARRANADEAGHPASLRTRHEAVGRVERAFFEEAVPRALPERFRTFSAGDPADVLVPQLHELVEATAAAPATEADGLVLLSLLPFPLPRGRRSTVGPNR